MSAYYPRCSNAWGSGSSMKRVIDEEGDMSYDPIPPYLTSYPRFCKCDTEDCRCGEDDVHEWEWDSKNCTSAVYLSKNNLEVVFHNGYSSGTAAVRGNKLLESGRHHYWEVKMITPVYGTDVMVGVGTNKVNLNCTMNTFCSLLGSNEESFGFSYKAYIQHNGEKCTYGTCFGQGSLVGVHVDTWKGTLQFFLNRLPLGVAFTGLRNLKLYPMVCSTAQQSKMRLTYSCSLPASLQTECLAVLRPKHQLHLRTMYPGLHYLSGSMLARVLQKYTDDTETESDEDSSYSADCVILDDYDFVLIGMNKKKKKRKDGSRSIGVS